MLHNKIHIFLYRFKKSELNISPNCLNWELHSYANYLSIVLLKFNEHIKFYGSELVSFYDIYIDKIYVSFSAIKLNVFVLIKYARKYVSSLNFFGLKTGKINKRLICCWNEIQTKEQCESCNHLNRQNCRILRTITIEIN